MAMQWVLPMAWLLVTLLVPPTVRQLVMRLAWQMVQSLGCRWVSPTVQLMALLSGRQWVPPTVRQLVMRLAQQMVQSWGRRWESTTGPPTESQSAPQ